MKIILFGATGFIGSAVLEQLLNNPSVTSIIVFSRRPLPGSPNTNNNNNNKAKLKVLLAEDFTSYSPAVLSECAGAAAAIWAIGTVPSWNLDSARKVDLESPLATANAFADEFAQSKGTATSTSTSTSKQNEGQQFRFVLLSGFLTAKDQNATLWFLNSFRRLRGEAENRLVTLGQERGDLDVIITRPAMVLPVSGGGLLDTVRGLFPNVGVTELAAALVHFALKGSEEQFVENMELKVKGKELLKQ